MTVKTRLVVVGNGMAGIRAVEEILSATASELFDITVFGDEPYGNYNRIMLSNVLAGADDTEEIYLNPLDWYSDNAIDLGQACASSRWIASRASSTPTTERRCTTTD